MSRGKYWTEAELRQLLRMRHTLKMQWSEISLPGRSSKACEGYYYNQRLATLRGPEPAGVAAEPLKPRRARRSLEVCPDVERRIPALRRSDLDVLRARFELRDRILERGITGGLLGDPPPGRSALDQRRASP